jgi:uncharacterized protein
MIAPQSDLDSAAWWAEIARHRFVLPRCGSCGEYSFPPVPRCAHCGSRDMTLAEASPHGTVWTSTTTRVPFSEDLSDEVPYDLVLVRMADGPRLLGRLCGAAPTIGLAVTVSFVDRTPIDGAATTLVAFTPTEGSP